IWSKDHLDIMLTYWHNNQVFDENRYTTWGLNTAYSRIRIADRVTVSAGVTAIVTTHASGIDLSGKSSGLLLTIATTID
ncbi:MAG TPA: hypothetical protein VEB86_15955, partial [Chryseosolibacter sp.]|nr:hypothetical protein [Chryseosolibacter sp.]